MVNRAILALSQIPYQWVLVGLSLGLGAFFAWYIFSLGLLTILVDQNAHLNTARQVIDSMTPGITQLGFWPPFLHVLMLPFVSVEALYRSGFAGTFTGVISLAAACFFLYHVLFSFTRRHFPSFLGTLLFLLNPYVLYYAVTPMTEIPFLALLFGTAYFLVKWFEHDMFGYLIGSALFIVLAGLTRFEGLILVPVVAAIVLLRLIRQRRKYHEIEAIAILFLFVAVLGGVSILAYSWFFGGDVFAFVESTWSAFAQQRDYERPAEGNVISSLQYFLHASYHMIGRIQVLVALLAFVALIFLFPKFEIISIALLLSSPLLFDVASLYQGSIVLYVTELPPFNWFYNERYGLYWIGFTVFVSAVLGGLALKSIKHAWEDRMLLTTLFFLPLVGLAIGFLIQVAFFDQYVVIQQAAEKNTLQRESQLAAADFLRNNYDSGKVFITRATHDILTVHAGISIKNFIFESNYRYFDQTLERPWLFARWVVMLNSKNKDDPYLLDWVRQNERISQVWGNSDQFRRFYALAFGNKFVEIYRLNEAEVKRYASLRGMDPARIPSLNPSIATWDPELVYRAMETGFASVGRNTVQNEARAAVPYAPPEQQIVHVVEKGDTLWTISIQYYGAGEFWKKIARDNSLRQPNIILPGMRLVMLH